MSKHTKRIDPSEVNGKKFGRLTAIKEVEPIGKNRRWLCKCDCGNETVVFMGQLRNGLSKSCGCLQKERASEANLKDLTGQTFGKLTVMKRVKKETDLLTSFWECMCDCGKKIIVSSNNLKSGNTQSCGCSRIKTKKDPKRIDSRRIDLTGRKFGELSVIKLSNKHGVNNTLLWECKCSCGNISFIQGYSLMHRHYQSCGCKRDDKRDYGAREHEKKDRIDGTRKTALTAKLHKGNKSGHKGVRWNEQRKKWTAHIGFKGKQISLGYFTIKEDAIAARLKAEEKYFKPILEEENE